jgi:hypothetical protein
MAAQREFLEVWLFFLALVLAHDLYQAHRGAAGPAPLLKWVLIGVLSLLSWQRVGVLFRLARGDVAALAAAACLLTPVLVLVLYLAARVLANVLGPLLRRGRPHYPFMPVVSGATLLVLALGLLA